MNYFNYFTEIEDTFIRRRGKHLFLSPLDWALIEVWQERGIPLHIVIRSIESVFDVFDKQPVGTRSIKSLFYCREEIEVQYEEWRRSQAGSSGAETAFDPPEFSSEVILEHLDNSIESLKQIEIPELSEEIGRAILRLEELKAGLGSDLEAIDGSLGDIEKMLVRGLQSNWESGHLTQLKKEVSAQLKEYKKAMEPEAYDHTFELMLLKRLREDARIPRLGLFFL